MSTRVKVALASIIWITVMVLGWRSFTTVLPQYGYFETKSRSPRNAQEWAARYQEEEAKAKRFLESTRKPTRVWAKEVPPGDRFSYQGWKSDDTRELVYVRNTPLRQVVSRLSNTPQRRVLEAEGARPRWDIEAILPAGREESVQALVRGMKHRAEIYSLPEPYFVFKEGTPTDAGAEPPGAPGRRTQNLANQNLGAAVRQLQGWTQYGASAERSVRNKRPLDNANAQVVLGGSPRSVASQIARIYGVALSQETRDTTHILVYAAGTKTGRDMDEWVRSITSKTRTE